jgi:primosomal protein N' (replication factor Y) (superfamily II helicase)
VPLDLVFTYRINGHAPVIGGRVLVPFREKRLPGIVVELHDREPKVAAKDIAQVLDSAPVLDSTLLQLGRWIAQYYIAPIGEVFRTMLPLGAEVKRARVYRIADAGLEALHQTATRGSSLRSRKSPEEQMEEMAVLSYLTDREDVMEQTLRAATKVGRRLLDSLVAKKWVTREDVSAVRDARRTVEFLELGEITGKLNGSQQKIVEALQGNGGRARIEALRELGLSRSSLETLRKRNVVRVVEEPADFHVSRLTSRQVLADLTFNSAQAAALSQIESAALSRQFSVSLLHGVTGSGKTAVYLAAMQSVLAAGKSAIMLVPEIGLTPAAAAHLHETFGSEVAILHSALTDDERAEQWHRIRRGDSRVVVGTRSAVFAPVSDLALIVVDEEHDSSYKQDETPRYHARDVAVMRAKLSNAAIVLGSATPSLESFHNAGRKYSLIEMPDRVQDRPLPEVEIIDMREEFRETGHEPVVSRKLAEEIKERLGRHEQALVLLNRRGYAPVVLCRTCGEVMQCENCDISLTHHKGERKMQCHYCGYIARVPDKCPACGSEYVYFLGAGSEKLEELLHGMFPTARIARLDRDTVRGHSDFERVLQALNAEELDIVVGTQMIAKGHDIHGVTLVGVVGADAALKFPDFRAAERTFQLLTQVAGRAGRGNTPGKVVLQTFFPDHYAVEFAAKHDYHGFAQKELRFRNWMKYPPFSSVANLLIRSDHLEDALRYAGEIGEWFRRAEPPGIKVLGPAPAPVLRLKRDYRYHFVLKSGSREKLNAGIRAMLAYAAEKKIPRTNLIVDIDAQSLM